ncbi:Histidine kinase-, DNA gyrase B-, and HSP90-like ATPase [Amycolatopsis arida]|uniref:histidine kinase n=1 Tax=Amycolatopsis arida TaxID=587909 RepID=A0A1I5KQT7_9PSEU|nr:ATP-binding protein [Amycolatopsis arida]TDX97156.1 histidine kinase/DNA gyrase B/HSP90-like ATPase [Amycolatopsis arida]SFO87345.1 Histidine kinase-, DNA gyrase B-, and HSP90-like ATPase [Amycolatopsis arida]
MATRARELLDRSRSLLDRSREAAAQFLGNTNRGTGGYAPRAIEAAPAPAPSRDSQEALVGICASIALRDLNLVDSLLAQLEEMEAKEEDQDRLAELYRLDHLATRLRRNAENLRVLAGRDADENTAETVSLVDVVRAAMSSIDQYTRVTIGRVVSLGVVGFAAEDLSRLLAEVLDNAANQSPPTSLVRVSAHLTEQGSVLLRIEDEGIGLPPERLRELNERLAADPVLDDDSVRHMGLAVVRRLAARHDLRVHLDRRMPHGTTATVLLPAGLVCELPEASWSGAKTVVFPPHGGTSRPADRAAGDGSGATATATRTAPATDTRADTGADTAEPLPRRRPAPTAPTTGGTTASGLPRRVPRSIKSSGERTETQPAEPGGGAGERDGHEQLLADLGAFSDGERAALDEHRNHTNETPAEDSTP